MPQRPRATPCLTNRLRFFPRLSARLLAAECMTIVQLLFNTLGSRCWRGFVPLKRGGAISVSCLVGKSNYCVVASIFHRPCATVRQMRTASRLLEPVEPDANFIDANTDSESVVANAPLSEVYQKERAPSPPIQTLALSRSRRPLEERVPLGRKR
jgi:hypothetical protein